MGDNGGDRTPEAAEQKDTEAVDNEVANEAVRKALLDISLKIEGNGDVNRIFRIAHHL
jgi:hypothetical protein